MKRKKSKNIRVRNGKNLLCILDECVKQFFPATSHMGPAEPSQWDQMKPLLSQKPTKASIM